LRQALFGGTFDPIHNAHLTVAREVADSFQLDRILFIPAANPPHKPGSDIENFDHRYRMVELSCQADPRFVPSRIEEGEAKSYSIHTIQKLWNPDTTLYFIIGADAFAEIRTWYRWQDVIRLTEFIVVTRPGHDYSPPEGARVHRLNTLALPVSSSEIRYQLAHGIVPKELPPAVANYIIEHGLYQWPKHSDSCSVT
jgi:nicotinate-nucleotide adenylyltransferase